MNNINKTSDSLTQLSQTIAEGFKLLHEDNNLRESLLREQFELQMEIQDKKNQKWKYGAIIGGIAVIVLGYSLHKTVSVFEDDMDTMSENIVEMSGYMKSMSHDLSLMSPPMVTMAKDIHQMEGYFGSVDQNMTLMRSDMGQMNRAMSPLMGNMQKFVPGRW